MGQSAQTTEVEKMDNGIKERKRSIRKKVLGVERKDFCCFGLRFWWKWTRADTSEGLNMVFRVCNLVPCSIQISWLSATSDNMFRKVETLFPTIKSLSPQEITFKRSIFQQFVLACLCISNFSVLASWDACRREDSSDRRQIHLMDYLRSSAGVTYYYLPLT